ncbi:MAG TPA: 16S rRNA (guanine(966)-N(2))-methyltransferase RsmD [Candidatus Dormibacteraeota bacterium]|jgi:16S rRNA (guanine966-N2)-methyltransferase|nr:16S rRNA (guanine(966)-N(2))-methyltransferase RsmD [Candidatus Dormibacteraeota bacterium]
MPLQVIGGKARGRRLKSPPGGVRPSAAILKKSLFDILGPGIAGKAVLDLYAGSGSLGVEALSRGAARCDLVERDRGCVRVISENLQAIGAEGRARVHSAAVETWIAHHAAELAGYDLVLADPPYGEPRLPEVVAALARDLGPGAMVVVEERESRRLDSPPGLTEVRRVRHGDSALTFFRREGGEPA